MSVTNADLLRIVDAAIPRYYKKGGQWAYRGTMSLFNAQKLPTNIDRLIKKIMRHTSGKDCHIEWLDVTGPELWTIQRVLVPRHLKFFLNRLWSWQRWPFTKLPILIRWRKRLIVWNGTHRTLLCRLAGKKVRARVFDIGK